MADDGGAAGGGRTMENLPMVDLSGVRDRAEVAGLRLRNIGLVLVPEAMPDLLRDADAQNVGTVFPVAPGTRGEARVGQLEVEGAALAAGGENTVLTLVGQIVVTPGVTAVGYKGLVLVGQVLLPQSGQSVLTGKILTQVGQIVYYDDSAPLRVFMTDLRLTKAFFDLVREPVSLVLVGDATFAADVTAEILQQKVHTLALVGDCQVEDPALLPHLQFMAKPLLGDLTVCKPDDGGA